MGDGLKFSLVRLRTATGGVVGAGFLIDGTHVLTCAHVAAQALGLPETMTERPTGRVSLDFPFIDADNQLEAHVKAWFGLGDSDAGDGISDIAVIECDPGPPSGAAAAPLTRLDKYWGRQFRAFGFPPGFDEGQYASGLLVDERVGGWVQIEDVKSTGYFVVPGFSGTPVWDVEAGRVVGMVVGADTRPEVRAAFMIPTPVLARAWPALEDVISATKDRPAGMGSVVAVLDTPKAPDFSQVSEEESSEFFGQWLLYVVKEFFDHVQIAIDQGSSEGVSTGDYFAVIPQEIQVENTAGDVLGSVIKDGSLIRVVQVQPEMSTCQLSDLAYESHLEQMTGAVEQFADKNGNIDLDQLAAHVDVFWPIQKGHSLMRVPSEERNGRDRVEELYGRTLDDTLSQEERRFLYGEMVRQTNEFLLEHASGYFASAMLFQRGYAQFQLEQYRDAIDTFELFLRRYPFSASADGAREWIDKAQKALS
jgi:Trypsin-like peptidase domain